ncbi:MFS transporter [Veillonella nakazawae]|uniref:MFS transporter n=1 Tax=Veillonella nakazawae TaxID=2682456 RepID=A0AB35HCF6_9FIRM|nr:MFS transporter [Veillonella nakazawae]
MLLSNVIPLSKELALPKLSKHKGWHISQFIESKSLPWALMGLFIGFTYSGVLVFIPIELNSMGAGIRGSAFFAIFALMIIISRPLVGKVYARYGSKFIIYPGLGLFILGLFGLRPCHNTNGYYSYSSIIGVRLWGGPAGISSVSHTISTY